MARACPLCGSTGQETVSTRDRRGNPLHTVLCSGCGIITNEPIPDEQELAAFYRERYRRQYKQAAIPRKRQVWRNFGHAHYHVASNRTFFEGRKRCLDMGSGSGEFLFMIKALGGDGIGIEPDEEYASYCRDTLGLDIRVQTLEEAEFAPGTFDFVRLSHVLEHMRDPVGSLKILADWLTDDGVISIGVPNIEAEAHAKLKGRMFHFAHVFNFNPYTLRLTANLAGLRELPDSQRRLGKYTFGFFAKGEHDATMLEKGPANAVIMREAMAGHNSRLVPAPRGSSALARLVQINRLRIGEMLATRRFRTHREIADHFASLLR